MSQTTVVDGSDDEDLGSDYSSKSLFNFDQM